jgi:cytoskeletal protein RodZ
MSAKEVGQQLRQARLARNLELVEIAKATRIRSHYLRALEEGEFDILPSPAQVRGFLRTYAEFLELDAQALFALLSPTPAAPVGEDATPAPAPAAGESGTIPTPQIFSELGMQLRQRRESLELTLPEVEANTRIPEHYVQRLEQGVFDSFPSPSQARGMLGNYADFLGLDSNALLLRYAEALQRRFEAKQAARPPKPKSEPAKLVFRPPLWLTTMFSRDILFGGLAGLLLIVFVVWSIGRIAAARAGEQAEPTAPPLTGLLLATPGGPEGTTTVLPGTPGSINLLGAPTATPGLIGEATIQVGEGAIQLRLVSLQRTWMRIVVDGEVQFEGRTLPGDTFSFVATGQILLLTGNGAALRAFLNEQDLGFLGIYGEVVSLVFTRAGAATPTLSPTPTVDSGILTSTANAVLTPSATLTPTPLPTAEPTATVDPGGDNP